MSSSQATRPIWSPAHTSGQGDTYVYDLQSHTYELVSVGVSGPGNGDSTLGSNVSFDALIDAFGSTASNLTVPSDNDNGHSDVFVVDQSAGTIGVVVQDDTTPAFAGAPVGSLSTHGTITFTDADLTDTHTVQVIGNPTITAPTGFVVPAGGLGTFTPTVVETAGSGVGQVAWTFTVDNALTVGLGALQQVQQVYTVQLSDGHGGVVTQNVTVSIFGINDAPVLTLPGTTASVNSGAPLALTGAHVADPDSGDVITLNLSVANGTLAPIDSTLPAGVTVDSSTPGALQVHGSAAAIDQLLNDGVTYTSNNSYVGTDTLTVTVHDAAGASDSQQVAITVNTIIIENGQTLEVGASNALVINFSGTGGTLKTDGAVTGGASTGISATSTDGAAMTITAASGVTSTGADAIDATNSGGAGDISITANGTTTGARVASARPRTVAARSRSAAPAISPGNPATAFSRSKVQPRSAAYWSTAPAM